MKKFVWGAAALGLMIFQSCDEKGVPINFGAERIGSLDTSYTAEVETPQARVVLIEEFTGASCTNCPDGHTRLAKIMSDNKDRVLGVAYHTDGGALFEPVKADGVTSKYDFRNTEATNVALYIYGGVSAIPVGGVDRIVVSDTRKLGRDIWGKEATNRMAIPTPVNLHLSSEYDATKDEVTISVKVAYTGTVTTKNALTISVLESNIIDAQLYPDHADPNYVHNHVLRKFLTAYSGKPVLDSLSTKSAGRVLEYSFVFKPEAAWNLDNCDILAFVSNADAEDKLVLQSAEVPLKK